MPKINQSEYEAAQPMGGEYKKPGAGGYVCAIQAVRTGGVDGYGRHIDYVADKMYVILLFDIVEGEYAGTYSDSFYDDKDYAHRFYLSWKNLGALKSVIEALDESNPGFDAMAAFEADQWEQFIGKRIGFVFGEEEYRANNGEIRTRLTLPRAKSVGDIRDGKFRVPALKKLDGGEASTGYAGGGQSEQPPTSVYDDIPFL